METKISGNIPKMITTDNTLKPKVFQKSETGHGIS